MANEQRKKHMLMATGDNGSVSWQPAFEDHHDETADRIVAGGFISGPSQPAAVARDLLLSLRATNVRVGYATVYPFPVVGRPGAREFDINDDTITPVLPEPEVAPSKADIVAALVYAVQLGSSTVILNDNADRVVNDYLARAGVQDTGDTGDEDGDGETVTTTVF